MPCNFSMDKENNRNSGMLIESVEMVNFMIHENMKVNFTNKITCLTGPNGSGKSAVMVALGVLFGQRAQALDRGNNVALIQTGKDFFSIKATIVNNRKVFVDSEKISLVKKVFKTGKASELHVLTGINKIKCTQQILKQLMLELNLNFGNPINFLSQENSKKILSDSSAKELYEFYYEGTEFKSIQKEIEEGELKMSDMNVKIQQTKENLKKKARDINNLNHQINFVNTDFNKALSELERENTWLTVKDLLKRKEEKEKLLNGKRKELDKINEKYASYVNDANEMTIIPTKEIEEKIYTADRDIANIKTDTEIFIRDYSAKKADLERKKARSNKKQLEEETKELETCVQQKKLTLKKIEEEEPILFEEMQKEVEKNQRVEGQRRTKLNELSALKSHATVSERERYISRFNGIKQKIDQNRHRFRDDVFGPVCECIDVKERKWGRVAMAVMKGSFVSFVVFNQNDKELLQQLFREVNLDRASVLMMQNKNPINFTKKHSYKTLLDILSIKHRCIENVLITMHNVEEIILEESREKAYEIARNTGLGINAVYLPSGDKIKNFRGNMSDYTERNMDRNTFFEDNVALIKSIERQLAALQVSTRAQVAHREHSDKIFRYKKELSGIETEYKEKYLELQAYEEIKDDALEKIERQLQVLDRQNEAVMSKSQAAAETKRSLMEEKAEIERKNAEIRKRMRDMEQTQRTQLNEYNFKKSQMEHEIRRLEKEKSDIDGEVLVHKTKAGEEFSVLRTKAEIADEKANINAFMIQAKEMGSLEELKKEKEKLEDTKAWIGDILKTFEGTLEETQKAIDVRKDKRDEIKNKKTIEICANFKKLTQLSNYEGELVFEHENKKLELKMKVHNNEKKGNKNTLSGGERTFAGVCFLLALWKVFCCPVKILDEFDVFMDAANRKNAINAIFEYAKEENIQLIIITPHNVKDAGATILQFTRKAQIN